MRRRVSSAGFSTRSHDPAVLSRLLLIHALPYFAYDVIEVPHPFSIWKRVLHVAHRAGFTKNEAGVIVFLAAALLAGGAIDMLRGSEADPQRMDASDDIRVALEAQDSVFAARSASPEAAPSISDSAAATLPTDAARPRGPEPLSARIDINRASETDLTRLPGIGPATAKKIAAYRSEHGRFRSIEDVMRVKSIGPKKFEKIRQFISVE